VWLVLKLTASCLSSHLVYIIGMLSFDDLAKTKISNLQMVGSRIYQKNVSRSWHVKLRTDQKCSMFKKKMMYLGFKSRWITTLGSLWRYAIPLQNRKSMKTITHESIITGRITGNQINALYEQQWYVMQWVINTGRQYMRAQGYGVCGVTKHMRWKYLAMSRAKLTATRGLSAPFSFRYWWRSPWTSI
jgi:hypothetical protein